MIVSAADILATIGDEDDVDERPGDRLLKAREVAERTGVSSRTVTRWAVEGRLAAMYTPGGHRRYWESDVEAFLNTGGHR